MHAGIRVAIVDDHQSIVDGYVYRLSKDPKIKIIAMGKCGEELLPLLENNQLDVLLLDLCIPVSEVNKSIYPIVSILPQITKKYPDLKILIITMFSNRTIIECLVKNGVSGYIIKDDHQSIQNLAMIVNMLSNGGIYFSKAAYSDKYYTDTSLPLTSRQLEVLSLCAAYPDTPIPILAKQINIADSTFRNILSGAYQRLEVNSRSAAIIKGQQLGVIPISPKQVFLFSQDLEDRA